MTLQEEFAAELKRVIELSFETKPEDYAVILKAFAKRWGQFIQEDGTIQSNS